MRRRLSLLLLAVALSSQSVAQTPPVFEAYSLRPLPQGTKPNVDAAALIDPALPPGTKAPSLLVIDVTLFDLLVTAYGVKDAGKQPLLMKQLPEWAGKDTFHLSARLPPDATLGQMRQMLQSLLHDRFALATHMDTRQTPVFLLEAESKHGPHLQPHITACEQPSPSEGVGAASTKACGTQSHYSNGTMSVQFTGTTLDEIADQVGGFAYYMGGLRYGPVVNATGLQGRFDAALTFVPLMQADVPGGQSLQDALRQQMGLVLRKGTASLPLLQIDHIERPSTD